MARTDPMMLPYRPCAGIMLLNREGLIWIGKRHGLLLEESGYRWQMPQGGIDMGEDPRRAALRELYEETGIQRVEVLAESRGWIVYDLPLDVIGQAMGGKYRGQRQKWFAMRFLGHETEIDLHRYKGEPEFDAWRWAAAKEVLSEVVPFKRAAYEAVLTEFAPFLTLGN